MLFRRFVLIVGAALLCIILRGTVTAEEAVPSREELLFINLEDILNVDIVTVSKTQEESFLAPGTVYVITEEEIIRNGWRFLQDALKYVPSVYIYDPHSWIWGGQRGLVSNFSQTLLLINGREVNNLIASEAFISRQFSTHNIKRIEVMASPGSALYGANALAGVINVITKNSDQDYEETEVSIDYGSFNSRGASLVFGQRVGGLRISGSGMKYGSDEEDYLHFVKDKVNYSIGWDDADFANRYITEFENDSRAEAFNLQLDYKGLYAGVNYYENFQSHGLEYLRWNYKDDDDYRRMTLYYGGMDKEIAPGRKLKVEYQYMKSYLWGTYYAGFWPDARLEAPDGTSIFSFAGGDTVDPDLSFAQNLHNNGYIDLNNLTDADIKTYFRHLYSNKNSSGSTRRKLEIQYDWQIDKRTTLITGYMHDYIDYVGLVVTDAATGIGATYDVPVDGSKSRDEYESSKYGLFAQLKRELKVDTLWLTAGVRYDEQEHYGSSTNPRIGAVWQPKAGSILKLMYGEAFREPNVFEISGDPSAEPAKLNSYELNYSQFMGNDARFFLACYHNRVTDFLGSVGSLIGTGVGTVEEQRVTGIEVRIDGRFGRLQFFINGSFILDAEQDYIDDITGLKETTEVISIPKDRANLGVTYGVTERYDINLIYSHTGPYEALSGNPSISETFTIRRAHELNLTLSMKDVDLEYFKLDGALTVTNLTDEDNYQANIRRSGPHKLLQDGRAVYLRLSAKW